MSSCGVTVKKHLTFRSCWVSVGRTTGPRSVGATLLLQDGSDTLSRSSEPGPPPPRPSSGTLGSKPALTTAGAQSDRRGLAERGPSPAPRGHLWADAHSPQAPKYPLPPFSLRCLPSTKGLKPCHDCASTRQGEEHRALGTAAAAPREAQEVSAVLSYRPASQAEHGNHCPFGFPLHSLYRFTQQEIPESPRTCQAWVPPEPHCVLTKSIHFPLGVF